MKRKCDICYWSATRKDVDGSMFIICDRIEMSTHEAVCECCKVTPCKYFMTREEADEVVESKGELRHDQT